MLLGKLTAVQLDDQTRNRLGMHSIQIAKQGGPSDDCGSRTHVIFRQYFAKQKSPIYLGSSARR